MNWDDLRFVLALHRAKTTSAAATRLGVTHTTVGRRVRAIETRLGARLFDRTPEGCVPTAAGSELAVVAARVEGEILAVEGQVWGQANQLSGTLNVSTIDLLFQRFRRPLTQFTKRHPSVELSVSTTEEELVLSRREADVVLRMSNTPPEYLVGRKIGAVSFAVYGHVDLVHQAGPNPQYGDFPWLHWTARMNYRWLDAWLAANAPGARIAMRMDNTLVMQEALMAGIGVHFLPCLRGDNESDLRQIGPVLHEHQRDIWMLTLPDLVRNSRVRAFMDHMAAELRNR